MISKYSDKQRLLATWWSETCPETCGLDGVIADGAVRSGKTWAMVTGFVLWSQARFSNQSFIVAGKSMGALKRNVLSPMFSILGDMGLKHSYNRSDGVVTVGSNRYHLFGASNEASQDVMQGMTAAGCYADEATLFPRSFVDQMVARCSVPGSKLWFNCNPGPPTHYFKTEWVDRADELGLLRLSFRMEDNLTLSPEVIARYERMFTGVFYERYVLGLWTAAEGMVYPAWRDALEPAYEVERDELGMPSNVSRWAVSIDYGTQNAFAALLWAFDGSVWHVLREYRHSGRDTGHQKTDSDYVRDMEAFAVGLPRDAVFIIDPSASSFKAAMRRAGFKVRDAKNDVLDGIRQVGAAMQSGAVRISEGDTPELQKEFAGYVWDDKADGDRPVKVDDHLMDALRYGVATLGMVRPAREYESRLEAIGSDRIGNAGDIRRAARRWQ